MKKSRFPLFSLIAAVSTAAVLFTAVPVFADISITPGSVVASSSAKFVGGTAGATITAGQTCYYDSSANSYKLADADASAAAAKVIGIAVTGASSGQFIRICTYDPSFTIGATVVIGDTFWTSTTPGGITKVASEGVATASYVSSLGVAISTTKIFLNPTRAGAVRP